MNPGTEQHRFSRKGSRKDREMVRKSALMINFGSEA